MPMRQTARRGGLSSPIREPARKRVRTTSDDESESQSDGHSRMITGGPSKRAAEEDLDYAPRESGSGPKRAAKPTQRSAAKRARLTIQSRLSLEAETSDARGDISGGAGASRTLVQTASRPHPQMQSSLLGKLPIEILDKIVRPSGSR